MFSAHSSVGTGWNVSTQMIHATTLSHSVRPTAARPARASRYHVLGEIASGGMATVYFARARDPRSFARVVALKRLHPHLEGDAEFVRMFIDEARLAARVRHPNVVSTLDVDDAHGLSIVMEYVDGISLLALWQGAVDRGERLPPDVVARIVLDLLAGLQAVHDLADDEGRSLGAVHRDVSPHNVLLDRSGLARLTDFGIARSSMRLTHTRDGRVKGKLSYMAPEQFSRDAYDHRVDVFAAGVVAWELLSGRRLFTGDNDARVLQALLVGEIPALDAHVPRGVAAAVAQALVRDPELRWQSCGEFAEALEAAALARGGIATHRAVAALVRRYDDGTGARVRASLTGVHIAANDNERISGVVRRDEATRDDLGTDDGPAWIEFAAANDGEIELALDDIREVTAVSRALDDGEAARLLENTAAHRAVEDLDLVLRYRIVRSVAPWPWVAAGVVVALATIAVWLSAVFA